MIKILLKHTYNIIFATFAVLAFSMGDKLAGYLFWAVYGFSLLVSSLAFLMVTGLRARGEVISNWTAGKLERLFDNTFDYAMSLYLVISGYWLAGFVWIAVAEVIKHTMYKNNAESPQAQP